ncbi:hypothetical protein [Sphingomonas agri]|uniref:hypothetical protein n=1 Tax=Sphingomonas agri TaxID=1813878 RepID=UPI00311D49FC
MIILKNPDTDERVSLDAAADADFGTLGYEGWVLDAVPIEVLREQKQAAVEALLAQKETGTCLTPVGTVKIDEASKLRITGALSLCRLQAGAEAG